MNRDMDLIRAITLKAREAQEPFFELDGIAKDVFAEHVQMMKEAGLVEARVLRGRMPYENEAAVLRLTWDGQNFADEIADTSIWKQAKEKVITPGASWTFALPREVLKDLLVAVVKQHV